MSKNPTANDTETPGITLPPEGYIDLHSHYVPAIDDGAKTQEQGEAMCRLLRQVGFSMVVATPHIRSGMFPNTAAGLREAHAAFAEKADDMPVLGLGAEHYFDDVALSLFRNGKEQRYPGGFAALIELTPKRFPSYLARMFFELTSRRLQVVLAHPERYHPLFRKSDAIDPLTAAGVLPQLDLMSLVGHYGRRPKKAAERMLDEDIYYVACSDVHRPADVDKVEKAIRVLEKRVGKTRTKELLFENPRHILSGTARY